MEDSTAEGCEKQFVAFGKHASLTFKELAATQSGYIKWLFNQRFFPEKYPELYEYLSSLGMNHTTKNGDYVTHNALQAQFTDTERIEELLTSDDELENVLFEDLCNADIVVEFSRISPGWIFNNKERRVLLIELKPTVSDDYPEWLRQMRQQRRTYRFYNPEVPDAHISQMMMCQFYTGCVPLETVKKIYGAIDFRVLEEHSEDIPEDSSE